MKDIEIRKVVAKLIGELQSENILSKEQVDKILN